MHSLILIHYDYANAVYFSLPMDYIAYGALFHDAG